MGTFGKIMVLVHGAVSIAVLSWAFGVYTQRITWTSADKDNLGFFDQHQAEATVLNLKIDKAFTRWSSNAATLATLDEGQQGRQRRRAFYPAQLYLVRTGKFNGADTTPAVQQLITAPNGYLEITRPTGRPAVESNAQALRSIDSYYRDMQKQFDDYTKSQAETNKHQVARDDLNKKIIDTMGPPPTKGLRTLLQEQRLMEDAAVAQERFDITYLVNLEAEFGLLKKRRDALFVRMKELTDTKTPAGKTE
jgi:hypothetical protein